MNVKCKALYLYFGYKILHFLKHGLSKKVYNMKIKETLIKSSHYAANMV